MCELEEIWVFLRVANRIAWFKTDLNSVPVAELFSDLTVNGSLLPEAFQ